MQPVAHIGIFVDNVSNHDLEQGNNRDQDGLILDRATVRMMEEQALKLSPSLANRVIIPIDGTDPQSIRQRAEQLTLTGDNVWVQVPVMTAGHFNEALIKQLLSEGVPLAVNGVASKKQAYQLLTIAGAYSTPLLLNLCSAMSRYDVIVSVALAHLMPQVQVISKAWTSDDFWDLQDLHLDGVILSQQLYTELDVLTTSTIGQACNVKTHQQFELVME